MSHARYQGRHRVPSTGSRVARGAAVTVGATVVGVLASTQAAHAVGAHDWSGVARCESSGNWHINTGNGFYGGLQFTQSTWDAYGGQHFAARADLASKAAQVTVAERVLVGQGVGAWPVCGQFLTGGTTPGAVTPSVRSTATRQHTTARHHPTGGRHHLITIARAVHMPKAHGTYTVQAGNTLSGIARAHHIAGSWHTLAELNRSTVPDPNLIFPGQTIRL